jgi:hypothetical protein
MIEHADVELASLREEPRSEWPALRALADKHRNAYELIRIWAGATT